MDAQRPNSWDGSIVLVSDPVDRNHVEGPFDRGIDRPRRGTVDALRQALESCSPKVIEISDLGEFTDRIGRHQRSLVFPYWFGERSRSRHGLVPAICEANGVMFVGADAFSKVVCNDKELSKVICRQAGLQVPPSAVVRAAAEVRHAVHLPLPVIVKPNYEGTSLGIDQRNLCSTWEEAHAVAADLIDRLGQPLVIETFIRGREFSACLMATAGGAVEIEVGAWKIEGKPDYLDDKVNSYDIKLRGDLEMEFEAIASLDPPFVDALRACFLSLGKVDLLRIDGRLGPEGACIIELTPDIYLGEDGEFALAFMRRGITYRQFVASVVSNCVEGYQARVPV